MAGQRLPSEIQDNILMHLMYNTSQRVLSTGGPFNHEVPQFISGAGEYACVCQRWQAVVEREAFHTIRLTGNRMTDAAKIITTRRQRYIRVLHLDVVLPLYGAELYPEVETAEEQQENNEVMTETMISFSRLLHDWRKMNSKDAGLTILFDMYSFGDETHGDPFFERLMGNAPDIFEDRFEKSMLEMTSAQDLPLLHGVTCFDNSVRRNVQRNISPITCCLLASKFPELRKLGLEVADYNYNNSRGELRNNFGHLLQRLPDSVREFSLEYKLKLDRRSRSGTNMTEDTFSTSLRSFSQRLDKLCINDGVIGDELFWPQRQASVTNLPFWPNLTRCHFIYATAMPSGESRFEYDYESNPLTPNKATPHLHNLYSSAATAARQMPQLQELMMGPAEERIYHTFLYRVNELRTQAQALWISCPVFQPESKTLQLWNDVSVGHTGADLDTVIGKTPDELIAPPDQETRAESLAALKACRKMLTSLSRPLR